MTPTDKPRLAKVLTGISEIYGAKLSAAALEVYWIALREWPFEEFERAAAHLASSSKFMPRPADWTELRQAATPDPGTAWATVLEHIRTGRYRDGSLTGDAVIDAAVAACGGFKAIAFHDTDKLHFVERRFAEHFATAQDRARVLSALPHLAPPPGLPPLPNLAMRRLS